MVDLEATTAFLHRLDLGHMARRGSDYCSSELSPLRLGRALDQLDVTFDFDFERLERVQSDLAAIDRGTALRTIAEHVVAGAVDWTTRHLRILRFLQRTAFNSFLQPMNRAKRPVYDALTLLHLNEMRCGHVARVAIDLFQTLGCRGRVVQLGGHIVAEVEYDGGWHLIDADLFDAGETPRNADGSIPSLAELSLDPFRVDALAHHFYMTFQCVAKIGGAAYPSYHYFGEAAYGNSKPSYSYKVVRSGDERTGEDWTRVETKPATEIRLGPIPLLRQPGAPLIDRVEIHEESNGRGHRIGWRNASDPDGDLAQYRVLVGTCSRGWNHQTSMVQGSAAPYRHELGPWRTEWYERLMERPPSDAGEFVVTEPQLWLPATTRDCFVTIWSEGRHGLAAGKSLWLPSDELRLPSLS
ncbi:MAG: hypothetical protein AB7I19_17735 [Planctomycetota bacterium]